MDRFSVTWDYRCPFARNAHEYVLQALRDAAPWEVGFVPFSLAQVHVEEGRPDVWEQPEADSGLLALQVGVTVRDHYPERFWDLHDALFALRHDQGGHLREASALAEVLEAQGLDAGEVFGHIGTGEPLEVVRKEHEAAALEHGVWGVPTFIVGNRAAFVRLMDRPGDDPGVARRTVERLLDLVGGWPELNELKHTTLDR